MFATIKTVVFRLSNAIVSLLCVIGRCGLWLLQHLLGLSWQPPYWLRRLRGGLSALDGRMRAHPRLSLSIGAAAIVLIGGSWYGWHWYKHLPQPHIVAYEIQAPGLTDYRAQPLRIEPLRVIFSESVAPLEAIGNPVERGVTLTPKHVGAWHWANDHELTFTPEGDWPIATRFQVRLDRKGLFTDGIRLDRYQADWETTPFSVQLTGSEFYQDPQAPTVKKIVATLAFSHPVDEDSVRKRVSIQLGPGLNYRDTAVPNPAEIRFDRYGLNAYIHSAPLATPLEGTQVAVRIDPGIRARDGGDAAEGVLTGQIAVPGRYQLAFHNLQIRFADNAQGEPEPVLMLESSSAIDDANLSGKVQAWLLPEKKHANERTPHHWSTTEVDESTLARSETVPLVHVPSIEPLNTQHAFKLKIPVGRQIHVKIAEGIEASGGYLNKAPTYALVRMPAYPRALRFLSDGALLGLNGEKKLGFLARGVSEAHIEIARLLPNQLHHLVDQNNGSFARPNLSDHYFDRLVERMSRDIPLPATDPSKTHYDHIDLSDYLEAQGRRQGVFVVRLSTKDRAGNPTFSYSGSDTGDLRFIAITDMGIIAKRSADGSHDVFVQSISNGRPVTDARVQIIGRNGLPVSESGTDADGRAHFANLNELRRERQPLIYVVRRGGDMSFLPISSAGQSLDLSRFDVGGLHEEGDSNRLQAYLFSDRGLYRPGETAHLGMIVRSADWKSPLTGLPVELRIDDPRGMIVMRQVFTLSANGFETRDFASSDAAPTGDYQATLSLIGKDHALTQLGSVGFKVRDFEPDRMKVAVNLHDAPVQGWLKPQQIQASVQAMHLFGAPASERRVGAELFLSPGFAGFAPYPDYRFRINNPLNEPTRETLADQQTDANGEARFDLRLNRFASAAYRLQLLAKVYEAESGRGVTAQNSVLVSAADYLVGVKSRDSLNYVAKGARRQVQWLAIGPDLKPRAVAGLSTELIEHRYVSVLIRQDNGTYQYQSRVKDISRSSQPLALEAAGATQTLDTQEPGDFSLVLKDADGNRLNQIDYSVAGRGNVSRSLEHNAELQLRLNKPDFNAGEEIEISIRAPYVGAGLITIERDRIYAQQWFKTDSTSSVQRIRVPAGLEGNAYVNVQFVRDPSSSEVYMSPLSYGVVPFAINRDARRMPLTVKGPDHIEPGQRMSITVRNDRPARAVVFAVDEGILQVARYTAPDPLSHFFRKRALEVDTSQILDLVLPEFSRLLRASAAGGDGEAALAAHLNPFQRKRRPPVAWWSGLIDLPAGETALHYPVPDSFNGKLHLFAVAVDPHRIGVAESVSDVRGPLVITPNVPAFVAPGDAFVVSAGVFSNLDQPTAVQYELQTSAGLRVDGAGNGTVQLSPRREATLEFRVNALETLGSADLRIVATLPGGKRVQITETTSVRPSVAYRHHLRLGRFEQASMELPLQRDLFPQSRQVRISAGPSPLAWTSGLTHYLSDYCYSRTEHILSKAMPDLVWTNERAAPSPAAQSSFDEVVRILRQRQNQAGGFGSWAATPEVSPYVSLYAADFLIEAKERGLSVPEDLLGHANRYLSGLANNPSNGLEELRNRAYASYLLTRQGVVVSGALADIRERYETYHRDTWQSDIGAAWLAASYKLLRQDALADPLFAKQPWRLLDRAWRYEGPYADPLIQDATHLQLLSRHFPATRDKVPPALLDRLGQRLNEQRYNALSAALLVRALAAYEQRASNAMTLQVAAWFDAQRQQALTLNGRPPRAEVPDGAKKLQLEKTGAASAFYLLDETGFDRTADLPTLAEGLEITRDYLNLKGQPVGKVAVGEEFLIRLRLRATTRDRVSQVAVVDLLPGGVEPVYRSRETPSPHDADENREGEEMEENYDNGAEEEYDAGGGAWQLPIGETGMSDWSPHYADIREDRVVLYGDLGGDAATYVYRVRATNPGRFTTPPAYVEGLFETTLQSRGKAGRLEIVKP